MDQLLDTAGRGKGSGCYRTEGINDSLQCHTGNGDQRELQRERNSKLDDLENQLFLKSKILPGQFEIGIAPDRIQNAQETCDKLRDDGGIAGAVYAHMKDADEQKIQAHVQEARQDQKIERTFGIPQSAQHAGCIVIDRHKQESHAHDAVVGEGIRIDIGGSIQQSKQGACQQEGHDAHQDREKQHDISGVGDAGFYLSGIPASEELCGDDAAAGSDTVAEGKEQKAHGAGGTDRSQCLCTDELPYDHRVYQVIDLLEQVADQHR